MKKLQLSIITILLLVSQNALLAQADTIKYQWPVSPLTSSQSLSATFCEFRNTGSADHFHDAVDMPEPDGNPVYPSIDGVVDYIGSSGSNSYVTVRTAVNGKYKKIVYLHILPNPGLSVGNSVVTGQTILGTIYNGMGHVHFTEKELVSNPNSSGTDINPIRPEGGLVPYIDPYPPNVVSSSLQFRENGSSKVLASNQLSGKVDIIIKIEERNGTSGIYTNNGTYIAGYRVWNADTSEVVFEPNDSGMKFKFDRQPGNSYVHQVFLQGVATLSNPVYILTNGDGASYVNNNGIVQDNYWNTDLLAEGNYILEIFAEDTRENTDSKLFPVTISKDPPELLTVLNSEGGSSLTVSWKSFPSPTLAGYRVYYTANQNLTGWSLAADESMAPADSNSISFANSQEFLNPTDSEVYYFYITAVDSNGNESLPSDIYSRSANGNPGLNKSVLIVDGFTRFGGQGSWAERTHAFNTSYFNALNESADVVVSSCANDAVIDNLIDIKDYDIVLWFVGDESRAENTLITLEQAQIADFLEEGGNLFITGNDIGFDLDLPHGNSQFTDTLLYRHYLNARFVHNGALLEDRTVFGEPGTIFEGLTLNFGEVYVEDSPDDIEPINGAIPILNYQYLRPDNVTYRKGGIAYTGTFADGDIEGKVVYLSFAAETISPASQLNSLMVRVLQYFDVVTSVEDDQNELIPVYSSLEQNYPNPFNPSTTIQFNVAELGKVSLKIYDILGREVAELINDIKQPGKYTIVWNALSGNQNIASGVYFSVLKTKNVTITKSMLLLK
ncbi:MAG: T9SS type A sorting domain-containing protein [Ignavibacteriae bacterium]|nr:T9SS C-terminal target domain-containing protein [Ignavibacteriota bacterium]NOG99962.1 T9SS type A sorting domain-containing protein [Ignavibacteriota bacterium]